MILYDFDAMSVPTCHTSHEMVVHVDQLIRHNLMHIVGTLYARKGPNGVSEASRGIKGESLEESDWMLVVLMYGQLYRKSLDLVLIPK